MVAKMHPPRARIGQARARETIQSDRQSPRRLDPAVVLYFSPDAIGEKEGACCGHCMMFVPSTSLGDTELCRSVGKPDGKGHCTVVEGEIDSPHGICGLYVHGEPAAAGPDMTLRQAQGQGMMPKEMAGYIEDGPTHCGNCEYFDAAAEACEKVAGHIEAEGCCNAWEGKDAGKDPE